VTAEPAADAPATAADDPDLRRRRLHPLSPLLHGSKTLMAVVAAVSWQGYAQLGFTRWLFTLGAALLLAMGVSAVSWAVTGYQILGRELRIHEGLLWRRTRAIPLERVQAVDVVRPLAARLTGLAELRLEVIGANKTEAPLAYLGMGDATRLRARLLALSAGPAAPPGDGASDEGDGTVGLPGSAAGVQPVVGRPLHTVENRQVLIGQLMTPHTWFVPFALVLTVLSFATSATLSFIGVASFLTALVGVVQVPVRRVLDDWNFRIWEDANGLRLSHGLLDTRNQTVPQLRIQAVSVTRPLLWRRFDWFSSRIDVAGYGGGEAAIRAGVLLPVADRPTTGRVVGEVLTDGTDVYSLPFLAPPRQARWLAPIARPYLGFALTDDVVAARTGVLTRQVVIVPLTRVQSVRVVQGPLQRRLGLATIHVDTAGRLHLAGTHRHVGEAYALAAAISDRSRAARVRAGAAVPVEVPAHRAEPAGPADPPAPDATGSPTG